MSRYKNSIKQFYIKQIFSHQAAFHYLKFEMIELRRKFVIPMEFHSKPTQAVGICSASYRCLYGTISICFLLIKTSI